MSDCPIFLRSDDESRRAQRIRVRAVLLLSPRSGAVAPRTLFFELGSCYGLVAEAPELPGKFMQGACMNSAPDRETPCPKRSYSYMGLTT